MDATSGQWSAHFRVPKVLNIAVFIAVFIRGFKYLACKLAKASVLGVQFKSSQVASLESTFHSTGFPYAGRMSVVELFMKQVQVT